VLRFDPALRVGSGYVVSAGRVEHLFEIGDAQSRPGGLALTMMLEMPIRFVWPTDRLMMTAH
jgi:hypothetical protein